MTRRDGRYPTTMIFPPPHVGLRLAELSAGLPGGSASSPRLANLVSGLADRHGWDEASRGVLIWRQVGWRALWLYLGRTRGWTPEQVCAMPPDSLLAAVESGLSGGSSPAQDEDD